MARRAASAKRKAVGLQRQIRIQGVVRPPRTAGPARPAAPTFFTSPAGPPNVLPSARVQMIFPGAWAGARPSIADLSTAVAKILASDYFSALSQYAIQGACTVNGVTAAPAALPATFSRGFTMSDVQALVQNLILSPPPGFPDPRVDPNLVYLAFMPPGTVSPAGIGGEHGDFQANVLGTRVQQKVRFGWVMTAGIDDMTIIASHELAETYSDPDNPPGNGWVDVVALDEIGDACEFGQPQAFNGRVDGVAVQSYWSDWDNDCVSPVRSLPLQPAATGWTQFVPPSTGAATTPLNPMVPPNGFVDIQHVIQGPTPRGRRGPLAIPGVQLTTQSTTSANCACISMSKSFHVGTLNSAELRFTAAWFSATSFLVGRRGTPRFSVGSVGVVLKLGGREVASQLFAMDPIPRNNNCSGAYQKQVGIPLPGGQPNAIDVNLSTFVTGNFDEVELRVQGYCCEPFAANTVQLAGVQLQSIR